mmetsp:Transcript_13201/g.37647  ORF Transcript_13201/g.37647 Transcript_13201/m.37647 type:complete len:162 (-) Transcript_13201:1210-1695(-)
MGTTTEEVVVNLATPTATKPKGAPTEGAVANLATHPTAAQTTKGSADVVGATGSFRLQGKTILPDVKRKRPPPANGAIILGPRPLTETMQVHVTAMAVQSDCCLFVAQFRATDSTLPGRDGRVNKPVKPKKWSQHKKRHCSICELVRRGSDCETAGPMLAN